MMVIFGGPRGGQLDIGLKAYASLAIKHFAKELNISRLKTNIEVRFHHKLYVDNSHCEGLCESVDQRNFIIDVALYGNWLSTLAHELVHVKQFCRGELNPTLSRWKTKDYTNADYWDQPWEKEARRLQTKLVASFEKEYS